jgi:hypothetical protein
MVFQASGLGNQRNTPLTPRTPDEFTSSNIAHVG